MCIAVFVSVLVCVNLSCTYIFGWKQRHPLIYGHAGGKETFCLCRMNLMGYVCLVSKPHGKKKDQGTLPSRSWTQRHEFLEPTAGCLSSRVFLGSLECGNHVLGHLKKTTSWDGNALMRRDAFLIIVGRCWSYLRISDSYYFKTCSFRLTLLGLGNLETQSHAHHQGHTEPKSNLPLAIKRLVQGRVAGKARGLPKFTLPKKSWRKGTLAGIKNDTWSVRRIVYNTSYQSSMKSQENKACENSSCHAAKQPKK